jgi:hypothetical protein
VKFFRKEISKVLKRCKVSVTMEWVADDVVEDLVKDLESFPQFVDVLSDLELSQAVATPIVGDVVSFDISLQVVLLVVHSVSFGI